MENPIEISIKRLRRAVLRGWRARWIRLRSIPCCAGSGSIRGSGRESGAVHPSGFDGDFMVVYGDFMVVYGDVMMVYGDFMVV